ncbi:MAG: DNA (cytosine-5-)-methyltransferase [Thermoguttaceae bacterium]|nr:DNA (cytosine-5-)-methyltransferase [Thermoguttaceae bacterium]
MNRVKEFRERMGLTVETLAERVGVSERLLRALEEDSSVASVEVAFKLAVALSAPFDELFGLVGRPGAERVFGRAAVEKTPKPFDSPELAEPVGAAEDARRFNLPESAESAAVLEDAETFDSPERVVSVGVAKGLEPSVPSDGGESGDELEDAGKANSPEASEAVVSEGAAKELDAALQKTALDAKKWAEKSAEIAANYDPSADDAQEGKNGENSETGENKKAATIGRSRAPRRSETKSSPNSKTAVDEGLAETPSGLVDPTAGRPIRFFDLFCGIGGFRFAAERTLAKMRRDGVCALSCDFDPPAQTSYEANFGERPFGDVAELPSEAIPDFDVLFAGFPCQAFSIIGLRKGFADETKGSLFFQIARILHDKRPRAFVLENVRQLTTHDGGRTFETILRILQDELGYRVDWRVMNALDCGLPQKRERVAIVGSLEPFEIAWPKPKTDGKTLADVLEPRELIDKKHFASPEIVKRRKEAHASQYSPAIWHENKSGNISSYPYSCALRAGASYNYLLVDGERRLTPREMLRLQGFPDSFKIVVSDAQIRKQAGNAAPVDLIERVLDRFLPLVFESGKADAAEKTISGGLF